VLAYIAKNPEHTIQEIAQEAGITLRAVQKIIAELEAGGYLARHKEGRRNRYAVHSELPMRHRLERGHAIGDILAALGYSRRGKKNSRVRMEKNISLKFLA